MYGLKQAGFNWYKGVHAIMVKGRGMRSSPIFPEIVYSLGVAVLTRVDDFLIVENTVAIKRDIMA